MRGQLPGEIVGEQEIVCVDDRYEGTGAVLDPHLDGRHLPEVFPQPQSAEAVVALLPEMLLDEGKGSVGRGVVHDHALERRIGLRGDRNRSRPERSGHNCSSSR